MSKPMLELEARIWCMLHKVEGESISNCCSAYMSGANREYKGFSEFIRDMADCVKYATNTVYKDGVYIIYKDGHCELFNGNNNKDDVKYVGLKIGSKSISVALHDAADKEVALTCKKNKDDYNKYIDSYEDVVSDWDGKENTEHLKEIGLNPEIKLEEGEYIAAGGEFSFINLFVKSINEALKAVGGKPLSGWYWTSSEYSAANSWYLNLGSGYLNTHTKVSYQLRVRAVAAFSL